MFTDLLLKSLDEPGMFEVVNDVEWRGGMTFKPEERGGVFEVGTYSLVVPAGYITDLASIPAPLRPFFSRTGVSRKPSVFHDWMYSTKYKTRKHCDMIFRQMLLERGVSKFKARLYYWGVRSGGWTRGSW